MTKKKGVEKRVRVREEHKGQKAHNERVSAGMLRNKVLHQKKP